MYENMYGQPSYMGQFRQNQIMQSQPAQRYEIIMVNGMNGANAMRMAPNSNALLLDSNEPIVYLAQTDGAGYKTVTPYAISPVAQNQEPNLTDLEKRIEKLEAMYNDEPTESSAKQQKQHPAKKYPTAE